MICGRCGSSGDGIDLAGNTFHSEAECIATLQSKIATLEEKNTDLRRANGQLLEEYLKSMGILIPA